MKARTATLAASDGALTIAMRPATAPAPSPLEHAHHQFLAAHWPGLAAAAFDGFRRHGAGAVVLMTETATTAQSGVAPRSVWYATQIIEIQKFVAADSVAWEAEQIEGYNPHTQGVFLFIEDGRLLGSYRVEGMLKPPAAHLRMQALLN